MHLWNTRTRELISRFTDHGVHAVRSVALSPVGHMLASGGDDGMIWLRDVHEQEKPGRRLDGHGAHPVRSVAFSADGHACLRRRRRDRPALENRTGEELDSLTGHEGPVCGVAFSPDGHMLASCGDDGTEVSVPEGADADASLTDATPGGFCLRCRVQQRRADARLGRSRRDRPPLERPHGRAARLVDRSPRPRSRCGVQPGRGHARVRRRRRDGAALELATPAPLVATASPCARWTP